jgi:uncharacterized protein DUF6064
VISESVPTMTLPFTSGEFFDVFAAYNRALWPLAAALWVYALVITVLFARGQASGRSIATLLAVEWTWAALAYHAAFFARINPAAWLFCALFLIEGGLIAWFGVVHPRMQFSRNDAARRALTWTLIVYALLYPLLARTGGHAFPALPTFGVPCPTTILTIGFLFAARHMPPMIAVIPLMWALVAGSAALTLGVLPDLMLWAGGAAFVVHLALSARPIAPSPGARQFRRPLVRRARPAPPARGSSPTTTRDTRSIPAAPRRRPACWRGP